MTLPFLLTIFNDSLQCCEHIFKCAHKYFYPEYPLTLKDARLGLVGNFNKILRELKVIRITSEKASANTEIGYTSENT